MELLNNYGSVSPPYWTEVWILGGGPSLNNFNPAQLGHDWRLPYRKTVLALNEVALTPPWRQLATAVFSIDSTWVHRRRDFLSEFLGEKYVALPLETFPECGGIPGVTYLEYSHAEGLSEDPRIVFAGCNTGYAAINLAYLKQAREIHLVGYDLNAVGPNADVYSSWVPLFRNMRRQLQQSAVEVFNHNPNSAIDAFPKVAFEKVL